MRGVSILVLSAAIAVCLSAIVVTAQNEAHPSGANSATVRGLPRVYGTKLDPSMPFDSKKVDEFDKVGYGIQVGAFIAPGIFFFLFVIIGFPLFCLFRYCCNCCCGCRDAKKGGYLPNEKWRPYIALVVLGAGLVCFGITGYVASEDLDQAMVGAETSAKKPGLTHQALNLCDNALGTIRYLNNSLSTLAEGTGPIVDQVNAKLDGSADGVLQSGTRGLVDRLNQFSNNLNNLTITVNVDAKSPPPMLNVTYICQYCINAANTLSATADNVKQSADGAFGGMNDTAQNVKRLLVDGQAQLRKYTGDAYDQVKSAEGKVIDAQKQASDKFDDFTPYEEMRRKAVLGLFCLPLITAIFIVLGGVCKSSGHPFTFACGLSWLTFLLLSIMLALHLPLSVLFADMCGVIDYADTHISQAAGEDAGRFAATCFSNASLTDTYNLTDKLSLSGLEFPALPNITDVFANFTVLEQTNRDVQALNFSTFGFDVAQIAESLRFTNNLTLQYESPHYDYTEFNISLLNEDDAPSPAETYAVAVSKYTTMELIDARDVLNRTLNAAKRNMSAIVDYVAELKRNMTIVQDSLRGIETLANPLIESAKTLARGVTCGFLGDAYNDVKSTLCDRLVTSMAVMSFMCFLICAFSVPILLISVSLSTRFAAPLIKFDKDGKPIPTNDKGEEIDGALGQNAALDTSAPGHKIGSSVQLTRFAPDGSIIVDGASSNASLGHVELAEKQFNAAPAYVPPQAAAQQQYYGAPAEPQQQPVYAPASAYGGAAPAATPAMEYGAQPAATQPVPVAESYSTPPAFGTTPADTGAPAYVPRDASASSAGFAAAADPTLIPGTMPAYAPPNEQPPQ